MRVCIAAQSAFNDIGKWELSYITKSASRGDAHSRERQMSAKADHARRSKSVLLGRKWNCEGVRSTLLFFYRKFLWISYRRTKSPPGRNALRRRGVMSLRRPAAGGESCFAWFFFILGCQLNFPLFYSILRTLNSLKPYPLQKGAALGGNKEESVRQEKHRIWKKQR